MIGRRRSPVPKWARKSGHAAEVEPHPGYEFFVMNVLSDGQRNRILDLLRAGKTLRRIEEETGHRRETIATYGRRAGLLDGGIISIEAQREPASMYDAHIEAISHAVAQGMSLREIHAELVRAFGLTGSYSALKRFIRVRSIGRDERLMLSA